MKAKSAKKKVTDEEYYDKRGVLGEIVEGEVTLSLDDALRQDILSGKRKGKLRNITSKLQKHIGPRLSNMAATIT